MITLQHYLIVSAALFSLGIFGVMTRKNGVNVLMGIELILEFRQHQSGGLFPVQFTQY